MYRLTPNNLPTHFFFYMTTWLTGKVMGGIWKRGAVGCPPACCWSMSHWLLDASLSSCSLASICRVLSSRDAWNSSKEALHIKTYTDIYRIAENFRGRKLSRISWFCGYTRNLGCSVLWRGKSKQSAKVFTAKITNSRKFSPSKVSRYTVHETQAKRL